jgi:hypothetical protein
MVNLPSFRQLEHLVMLADHSHFGHAARACHVTQSTLSASIKELENVLQAPLVDRTKRRVVFTRSASKLSNGRGAYSMRGKISSKPLVPEASRLAEPCGWG